MQIWVDADACPKAIKEILFRVATRTQILVTLVANQALYAPPSPYLRSIQVPKGFDVADNEIVARVAAGDLVITADIPLAAEVIAKGARVLAGGEFLAGEGFFYAPTVIADACEGMRVVDEEQFGPALPVIRYTDLDDAIAQANASDNGLGGSIWTSRPAEAAALALRLECGSVWINEHGAIQPDAPFGGVKQSGVGVEFGMYGLEEYLSLQTVKIMKG